MKGSRAKVGAVRLAVRSCLRGWAAEHPPVAGETNTVLAAVSGGTDSLALAWALSKEAPLVGAMGGAVIVDHGLQRGSADVAAATLAKVRGLGLRPASVVRVRVDEDGGTGLEAAARAARYGAFVAEAVRLRAGLVLTAHTADDNAEQVLLGLQRGSGLKSLAGIGCFRRLSDAVVVARPLLRVGRAHTEAVCVSQGLEPWQDPHNSDERFARVRVRRTVLPFLEGQMGPGVRDALLRTAVLAGEAQDALEQIAVRRLEEFYGRYPAARDTRFLVIADVQDLPVAVLSVLVRLHFGVSFSFAQSRQVVALLLDWRGQGPVCVSGGVILRRAGCLFWEAR